MQEPVADFSRAQLCIHQLFEAQVLKTPQAIALQFDTRTLTYAQLNQKANQLAYHLISLGVVPDSLVAVSTLRSLEMVIAILGVLKAGAAYVPIDPAYPAARQSYLLKDALQSSPISLLLTHSTLYETLSGTVASLSVHTAKPPIVLSLDTDWPTVAQQPQHNPCVKLSNQNLAYVIYTSGSTGNPKGVMIEHRGVVNHATAMAAAFEMTPADRMLQFSSMSFDIIVEELYPTLITGAALVLRPEEIATSLSAFLTFVAAEEITILDLPTAFWHELVSGLARKHQQKTDLQNSALAETVRLVIVGGEKASRAIYAQWFERVGDYPRWLNTYGPTEATVTTTLYDPLADEFDLSQELPIGRAIANATTYVLSDTMQPVAPDEPGELYIGGPGLARGYLNLPEKTAVAFVAHPFEPGARLYKTGDIVRQLSDGNLAFVGRADFQVKIRGFRIELGEIERCLEKHPDIRQQIVLAREDVPGQKRLVAYVVADDRLLTNRSDSAIDVQALQSFMRETLPSYMVPSAFVALSALPMTPNGKVDRRALPAPADEPRSDRTDRVAPQTPLEAELVEIWEDVLGIQPVGITDDFFEMGGHSLLVMRLFNEIEATFESSLPVTTIFEAPTVEQLAPIIAEQLAGNDDTAQLALSDSLVLLKAGSAGPPFFLIHDADGATSPYIHLAAQFSGDRAIYGIKPLSQANIPMVHSRIPRMAAHYIDEIRRIQPRGPYLIGGLCAGGVIAFEMALQLEAVGETVALTALLEAPDVAAEVSASLSQQRLQNIRETLPTGKKQMIASLLKKAANVIRYEASKRFNDVTTTAQLEAFRYWQDRRGWGWTLPETLYGLDVRSLYLFAEKSYEPGALLNSQVILVKANGPGLDLADQPYRDIYKDPLFGWRCRVQQPIKTIDMPGGHSTMLNAENAATLAETLGTHIEQVLTEAQ
ncbi:MAG: amino acid adenylation domain-containing protein [Phormidesmis sp.]